MNTNTTGGRNLEFRGGLIGPLLPLLAFVGSSIFMMVNKTLSIELMLVCFVWGVILMVLLARSFGSVWSVFETGMADKVVAIIIPLYMLITVYSGLIQISQLAQGVVWLIDALGMNSAHFVVLTFVACSVVSTATGSTTAAIVIIGFVLYPVGLLLGCNPGVLMGAIFAGSAVGDNIGPTSDVTILSSAMQTYTYKSGSADIPGVVRSRWKYAAIAFPLSVAGYIYWGDTGSTAANANKELLTSNSNALGLVMLLPMLLLLYLATYKRDIFKALIAGIVSTLLLGLAVGLFSFHDLFHVAPDGSLAGGLILGVNSSLLGMMVLAVLFLGYIEVLKVSGTIDKLVGTIAAFTRTPRSSEIVIWILGFVLTPLSGTSPTGLVMMLSPFSDRIGRAVGIHPYRRANMVDAMATSWAFMVPFGTSILLTFSLFGGLKYDFMVLPTPMEVFRFQFYGWAILLVMLVAAITGWGITYEGRSGEELDAPLDEIESPPESHAVSPALSSVGPKGA